MAVHSHAEGSGSVSDCDLIPIHISEVERLTGIGRNTLLREIREGRLAACRIGRQWHMTRGQIVAWLKRVEVPARES